MWDVTLVAFRLLVPEGKVCFSVSQPDSPTSTINYNDKIKRHILVHDTYPIHSLEATDQFTFGGKRTQIEPLVLLLCEQIRTLFFRNNLIN